MAASITARSVFMRLFRPLVALRLGMCLISIAILPRVLVVRFILFVRILTAFFISLLMFIHFISVKIMPLISFDRILKIILTILNVLSAALRAFDYSADPAPDSDPDDNENGHA